MEPLLAENITPVALAALTLGLFIAGACKGILGLGLPLIGVPVLATFLPTRDVVAILWLPMMWANAFQAFQGGGGGVAFRRFWPVMAMMAVGAWVGTILLVSLDDHLLLGIVGGIVVVFSALSLAHPRFALAARLERPVGLGIGIAVGVLLGVSLHMGPLLAIYFVAIGLPKEDFIRAIGATFFAGVVLIGIFYLAYGVFEPHHVVLTIGATVPVAIGGWVGQRLRTRVNEARFRKALFVLLILIGANLIRRAVF
ncbi:MAG: TSUP family transporter [Alphaproteobacteria bacterium]|nr:TSUP family transporter [Alphaproteobacteria bacterium]